MQAQLPYLGNSQSDGLGFYRFIEKDAFFSARLYRNEQTDIRSLYLKYVLSNDGQNKTYKQSITDNNGWVCNGDSGESKITGYINLANVFGGEVKAGSTISSSIYLTDCDDQILPNESEGFNITNFKVIDVQTQYHPNLSSEVLFDNKPYLVGAFRLDAGRAENYLNGLEIINRGNAKEGLTLANEAFRVYYESASNKFEFNGDELAGGILYGDHNSDNINNNVFGNSSLNIPLKEAVWVYVVMMSGDETKIDTKEDNVTISIAIKEDGLMIIDDGGLSGNVRIAETNISENRSIALPLKWISFKGTDHKNSITLQWITTSQLNVDHFELEACLDKINWVNIGRINVSDQNINAYNFEDNRNIRGINYFRILQVDKNEQKSYSKVIAIKKADRSRYLAYPNNTNNILSVTNEVGERYTGRLEIYDTSGRKFILNSDSETYLVSHLQPGIYFALVGDQYVKFIKY